MRAALASGLDTFGENRVQEAAAKRPAVAGGVWHLVGRLQSNKAARAASIFEVIESVDSEDLARRLSALGTDLRGGRPLPIYLQVNVDRDPAKTGFDPNEMERAIGRLLDLDGVEVRGLMTVGRLVDRPDGARPTFRRLRELSEQLCRVDVRLGRGLSMGMSDDFEVAVEEGSTLVRIGRALFGDRPRA